MTGIYMTAIACAGGDQAVKRFFTWALASQALGYLAASACALACDMTILWLLVSRCAWDTLVAASVSFLAGTLVAYALSVALVFNERRLRNRSMEFAGFAALGAAGRAVNAFVMFVAMKYLGLFYLGAKCLAAGCTVVCNFVSRRQLLFVAARGMDRAGTGK